MKSIASERITKRMVDAVQPANRDQFVWDSDLKGFGLKITPGGNKSYVVQYRFNGRTRRLTIGRHGNPWNPDTARKEAIRQLGAVASGEDPAAQKQARKKVMTVAELCDVYVAEGCATKKETTIATDLGRIRRHIKPLLGKKRISDVTKADVERMMNNIADGKTATDEKTGPRGRAIVKGGRGTATKSVMLLGAIFSFATNCGWRTDNPAHGVRTFPFGRNDRFLSEEELNSLGEVLDELDRAETVNPFAIWVIRLLLLTGCRKSEITSLKWSYVDHDRRCFRLPDSKSGARLVGLGCTPLQLISELPKLESEFLFPAHSGKRQYLGTDKIWRGIIRKKAGLEDVRLHDLRHTYASVGAELGYSELTIGALLGHASSRVTSRYIHFGRDPLGDAADQISSTIWSRMNRET